MVDNPSSQFECNETLGRRDLLRRGGGLAIGLGLAPALLGTAGALAAAPKPQGTINFMGFEGDDLGPVMRPWVRANKLTMQITSIGSAADIIAKLSAPGGGGGVDLVAYPHNAKRTLGGLDLLQALDESKIPNLARLDPVFKGRRFSVFTRDPDGKLIAVPYYWNYLSLTYDSSRAKVAAWADVLKPANKGKVVMVDFPFGNLAIACHLLKLNMGALPKSKLSQVVDYLKRVRAQAKSVAPTLGDQLSQLIAGEATIAYAGQAFYDAIAKSQGKPSIRTLPNPKEKAPVFVELFSIPKEADNADAAYAYINEVLSPKRNAGGAVLLSAAATVKAAASLVTKSNRSAYPYGRFTQYFKTAPTYFNPPGQSDQFVTVPEWFEAWAEIKAGG